MTEEIKAQHTVPGDLAQIPIVWRYELLKYLRSWRLYAAVAIVVAITALIYLLPPALGHPYSGTDVGKELWIMPGEAISSIPGVPGGAFAVDAVGFINRSQIDVDSLVLYRDGVELPSAGGVDWHLVSITYEGASVYLIVFAQDISGSVITADYEWYTSPSTFSSLFLSFAGILVIICATFFGADALVSEFQNRTGYLVFPNPMKRHVLFMGKYAASVTAGLLLVGLFYVTVAALSFVSARGLADNYLLSFAYAFEYLLAAMAVAYVISSVLKGTTGATVLTFFMFLMILPIIDSVAMFTGVKIEGSLTFAANVMTYILIEPYPQDFSMDIGGFTMNSFYPDPALAAVTMMAYVFVALALSMFIFKRKQLAG